MMEIRVNNYSMLPFSNHIFLLEQLLSNLPLVESEKLMADR